MSAFKPLALTAATLLTAAQLNLAAPAEAAPASATVAYGDLDLATQAGQATLDRRIHRAARDVCASTALSLEVACTQATVAFARQALPRATYAVRFVPVRG